MQIKIKIKKKREKKRKNKTQNQTNCFTINTVSKHRLTVRVAINLIVIGWYLLRI